MSGAKGLDSNADAKAKSINANEVLVSRLSVYICLENVPDSLSEISAPLSLMLILLVLPLFFVDASLLFLLQPLPSFPLLQRSL